MKERLKKAGRYILIGTAFPASVLTLIGAAMIDSDSMAPLIITAAGAGWLVLLLIAFWDDIAKRERMEWNEEEQRTFRPGR
jgi:hypothetical protein